MTAKNRDGSLLVLAFYGVLLTYSAVELLLVTIEDGYWNLIEDDPV